MSNQGNILKSGFDFIRQGRFLDLLVRVGRVMKKVWYWFVFQKRAFFCVQPDFKIQLQTDYPIAFESPDHINPHGTKDNFTSRVFVLKMDKIIKRENKDQFYHSFLDLGCAGGRLVKDFKRMGYLSVGLEGSDYNLKHNLCEWWELGGKNLFTCDITKPFRLNSKFNLITAWEVMEHMPTKDLIQVFKNIVNHLESGGYFIASTSPMSDMTGGVELHQTRWSNRGWKEWIKYNVPDLEEVDVGLKYYEHVRYNLANLSILTYRKR